MSLFAEIILVCSGVVFVLGLFVFMGIAVNRDERAQRKRLEAEREKLEAEKAAIIELARCAGEFAGAYSMEVENMAWYHEAPFRGHYWSRKGAPVSEHDGVKVVEFVEKGAIVHLRGEKTETEDGAE